jgi:hypothetical protein
MEYGGPLETAVLVISKIRILLDSHLSVLVPPNCKHLRRIPFLQYLKGLAIPYSF